MTHDKYMLGWFVSCWIILVTLIDVSVYVFDESVFINYSVLEEILMTDIIFN